jgi:hypothetical protein
MPSLKKNRAKSERRGQKRGAKVGVRAKRGVRGIPDAVKAEVAAHLKAATHLTHGQKLAFERSYTTLGISADRLRRLVEAGTATTTDQAELRRAEDRMKRALAEIGAGVSTKSGSAYPALNCEDREAFCAAHLTTADGEPFSLVGREWQRDQFWAPLDGYRLWAVDPDHLCAKCSSRAGRIVPSVYESDSTRTPEHAKTGCSGLYSHIIWLVALQLKRQQGKTTAVAGFATSSLVKHARESIAYIAGSEDQSEEIFRNNFGKPILASDALKPPRSKLMRTRLSFPENESEFALFPTSLAGSTGGSRTLVIVDEARDVPSEVFGAFVPQVYARNGWRCPSGKLGHTRSSGDLIILGDRIGVAVDPAQERYGSKCQVCGLRLEPWSGRVAAMSSAQELDGSDADWFDNMCGVLEQDPIPDAHVFRSVRLLNPKVQQQIVSRTEAVLGKVPGLGDAMAIEAGGVSRRKGERFVEDADITAVVDKRLENRDRGERPGVAFLDTSTSGELTSFVCVEDDSAEGEKTWDRIVMARLDVWVPKEQTGGIIDEKEIEEYLEDLVPRFKLLRLRVDDRHEKRWRTLVEKLRRKPWGRIVIGCTKLTREDRRLAWNETEARILGKRIRIFDDADLKAELKGARKYRDADNRVDVREPNRRRRHLDISESLAGCCYDVQELAAKGAARASAIRGGGSGPSTSHRPALVNRASQIFGKLGENSF